MTDERTFGRRLLDLQDPSALLALEEGEGHRTHFRPVDDLVGSIMIRAFAGERVLRLEKDPTWRWTVQVLGLEDDARAILEESFSVKALNSRGSWNIPETAYFSPYGIDLPWAYRNCVRFPNAAVAPGLQLPRASLTRTADAVLVWGVLAPLAEVLVEPIRMRGPGLGTVSGDEFRERWDNSTHVLASLGIDATQELAAIAWGSGYIDLRAEGMLERRRALLEAIARQVTPEVVARFRVFRMRRVIERYYQKARPDGTVLRKNALTKELDQIVALTFGGSWLAFLEYVGERPHAKEQIVTAEHTPRLHVGGSERATALAKQLGVPAEEIARIAGLQWERSGGVSPVETRTGLLKRYWGHFDEAHAHQKTGDLPLLGLLFQGVGAEFRHERWAQDNESPEPPPAWRRVFPAEFVAEVFRAWPTVMLVRWPDTLVTNPEPLASATAILGPALSFWHELALTAWYVCAGPYARTDIAGMEEYYARAVKVLADAGMPIDHALFRELRDAESLLGPPEEIYEEDEPSESEEDLEGDLEDELGLFASIEITSRFVSGHRREGFEILRDIITKHRRAWAAEHLDTYLASRWKRELGDVESRFAKLARDRGSKPPTLKQFLKQDVAAAANNWFAGDLRDLYTAIGETLSLDVTYVRRMPDDPDAFVRTLFDELRRRSEYRTEKVRAFEGASADRIRSAWRDRLMWFAEMGLNYIQLEEALGRLPTLAEFGADRLEYRFDALADSPEAAWAVFETAISTVRAK